MFYFSATRAAYLVASLHKENQLPDGSVMIRTTGELPLLNAVYFDRRAPINPEHSVTGNDHTETENGEADVSPVADEQQSTLCAPTYEDWCGIVRDHHGPFWPPGIGAFYPPPRHIYPELGETFRGSLSTGGQENRNSLLGISKQAARIRLHEANQNQEAKLSATWGQARVIYDSECSPRWTAAMLEAIAASSQLNVNNGCPGWIPPTLAFESRFESGNLRQARRVFDYINASPWAEPLNLAVCCYRRKLFLKVIVKERVVITFESTR
ncbi:unnamed protein product [Echinostoma caproni]|uniref:Uncharacterized protein n=1 Tax=Echinostoma caproni TaxID=27848 RepID=A0A183AF00_9TREM|nr:unnamed protein product [Echinostoma caproni]